MRYYIIGSGGFAKEVLFLCKEVYGTLENFAGFIDFQPKKNNLTCMGSTLPVLDEDEFLKSKQFDCILYIGIGDPKTINKVSQKFQDFHFPNLIHENVVMDNSVELGKGNIITAGCILTVDIKIGNFNIFNLNTTIGHDTSIEDCNVFNPGANISGSVIIESNNLLGTNCTLLQGVHVGTNSVIGAASLVNRNVVNNSVVLGVPAKEIKKNE